jgi:phosphoserine phosphatase
LAIKDTSASRTKSRSKDSKHAMRGPLYDLRQFDVAEPEAIQQKLDALRSFKPNDFIIVADFDNTLARRGFSIWEALRNALPEAGRAESDSERRINLAREYAGDLTTEEVIAWSKHEFARYVKYGITTEAIADAVRNVKLRIGARKLFGLCAKADMERHILSASVADAIEIVAKHKRLRPTRVHSNRLRTKDGSVIEWDEDNMLHNLNKHEYALRLIANDSLSRDSSQPKIVLGDTRYDADVISGENVLRIRMKGRKGNTPKYLADSFAQSSICNGYDLVLRSESLLPVVNLVKWLTDKK